MLANISTNVKNANKFLNQNKATVVFIVVTEVSLVHLDIPINLTPVRQFQIDPQSCCLKKAEVVVPKGILELIF